MLRGASGLLYWNVFTLGLILICLFLPPSNFIGSNLRYIMFNALISTAFTWWRLGVPIRMIWPVRFILLLQVWLTICSFLSMGELARTNDFETSNYFLIVVVIYYFNAAVVGYVWHEYRRWVVNILLVLFGVSCAIGFLQFLKIPPALAFAKFYNQSNDITAWGGDLAGNVTFGRGSVRAIGLAGWPEWLAFEALMGWGLVASRLLKRSLVPWEFALASFFLVTAFAAQSRIMYLSLFVCILTYLYLLIKRDPHFGKAYIAVLVAAIVLLFVAGGERMNYALSTNLKSDTTLAYRQEIGWQQAYSIMADRPWVGIGPDDRLVWSVRTTIPDRFTQGAFLDNGFLLLLCWGGLPALALYLPIILIGLGAGLVLVSNKKLSFERRQMGFIGGLSMGLVLNNMMLNNGFTNIWMNCVLATIGALALPNSAELVQELRSKYHIRRGKETQVAQEYAATTE